MAEAESIICIFCGGTATIKTHKDREVVSCPQCMRETELDKYKDMYDLWLGDIRDDQ